MNVTIVNENKGVIEGLDIEIIKSMEGIFTPEELVATFSNFYYEKMILDITSIKDYKNLENIKKISSFLDMNKTIIILEDNPDNDAAAFLSKLISLGIYNFTKNTEGVKYLLTHPNEYKDVAKYHIIEEVTTTETTDMKSMEGAKLRIIGVKNVTEHAGSTTLVFMMKKMLERYYNTKCLEVDKTDFSYFKSDNMISTTAEELPKEFMRCQSADVVLIDLNDYEDTTVCTEVLYLMEPTTLRLNKLVAKSPKALETLKDKKIVLNRTNISSSDVAEFEYEGRVKVFHVINNVDERLEVISDVVSLLLKMGYSKVNNINMLTEENKKGIFDIFKG